MFPSAGPLGLSHAACDLRLLDAMGSSCICALQMGLAGMLLVVVSGLSGGVGRLIVSAGC